MAVWLRFLINPRVARAVFNPRTFRAFGAHGARTAARARLSRIKFNSLVRRYGPMLETAVAEYPELKKKFNDTYREFQETQTKLKGIQSSENAKAKTYSVGKLVVQLNQLYEKLNTNISDMMRYKKMADMARAAR